MVCRAAQMTFIFAHVIGANKIQNIQKLRQMLGAKVRQSGPAANSGRMVFYSLLLSLEYSDLLE